MKKKIALFSAALAMTLFAAVQPAAAQERYFNGGPGYSNHERFYDGRGNFAYRPAPDWRAREYRDEVLRDRAFREHEWRERQWREQERCNPAFGYRAPAPYVGFQFYGR